jgi:hypothetical protein
MLDPKKLFALVVLCLVSSCGAGETPAPNAKITSIDGVDIQRGKLTRTDNFIVEPQSQREGGGYVGEELLQSIVSANVLNVEALKKWSLCPAELRAEAELAHGRVEIFKVYPNDLPFNNGDPALNAQRIARYEERALLFEQAARLAEKTNIACVVPDQPVDSGNYAKLIGREKGVNVTVFVVEYDVIEGSPVEFYKFAGECPKSLAAELKEVEVKPVDTVVNPSSPVSTFSEHAKAYSIAWLKASGRMLETEGVVC